MMLLPALLAALVVAPASASTSVPHASCLHAVSGKTPSNLDELRDCQSHARAAAVAAAKNKGAPLTDAQLDALDDDQRAEARKFLAQPQIVAAGGATPGGATGKLGGVTTADLGRADPKSAAAIGGLQGRMQAAAGDGSNGITATMADDARATLIQAQGSISPDMASLLDAVQHDGGKLTPETMKKLQGAGSAAKGDGLDLNIDPKIEKQLLESDFDKDKPDAGAPPAGM